MDVVEPVVSYILTTKNRAPYLEQALDSLTTYVTSKDELIVVDGGSTDHTKSVIEEHDDLVTAYISEDDRGEAHGYNKAMLMARGEFIKFVTDDDVIFPEAMREAVRTLQRNPAVDAILCGGEEVRIHPETGEKELIGYHFLPESDTFESDPLQLFRSVQCGVGLIFRRRLLPLIGLLDCSFRAVDTDFMFRMLDLGLSFRYLNIKLYRHYDLPHSGMHLVKECHRDRLRIASRTGHWQELMNEHIYTPQLIREVIGLTGCRHGKSAMIAILEIERLRRSRFGWILPPLAHALRLVGAAGRRIMLPFRRHTDTEGFRRTEPHWDGSLR